MRSIIPIAIAALLATACTTDVNGGRALLGGPLEDGYTHMSVLYAPVADGLTPFAELELWIDGEPQDMDVGTTTIDIGTHTVSVYTAGPSSRAEEVFRFEPMSFAAGTQNILIVHGPVDSLESTVIVNAEPEDLAKDQLELRYFNADPAGEVQLLGWPEADRCTRPSDQASPGTPEVLGRVGYGELLTLRGTPEELAWITVGNDQRLSYFAQPCAGMYGIGVYLPELDERTLPEGLQRIPSEIPDIGFEWGFLVDGMQDICEATSVWQSCHSE